MTYAAATTTGLDGYPRVSAFLDAYVAGPGSDGGAEAPDLTPALARAETVPAPFTIATIDDFLPLDLYHQILRDWATLVLGAPSISGSTSAYVGSRTGIKLYDYATGQAPQQGTSWDKVVRLARHPRFVRQLFTRYAAVVEDNLTNPAVAGAAVPGLVLWANRDHGPDEALGAHLDGLHKLLTIVLYLDLDGPTTAASAHLWGTAVYQIDPGTVTPVEFSSNAARQTAGSVEFRPNRAVVMPNNDRALHGVAGGQDGLTRRSLMWGYWYHQRK